MTVKAGTFQVGTGVIGTKYGDVTLGFRPAVVFFVWSGKNQTGNDGAPSNHNLAAGEGAILENGRSVCIARFEQDAADPYGAGGSIWNDKCIVRHSNTTTTSGRAAFSEMTDSGFNVQVTEVFGAEITVQYIAISGVEVNVVEFTEPGAAGVVAYTGAGLRPTFAKFWSATPTAYNTPQAAVSECSGVASGSDASQQAMLAYTEQSGAGAAFTSEYSRSGECLALMPVASANPQHPNARATLIGFTDDGFELNWLERAGSRKCLAVVATGRWHVFNFSFHLDTAPWSETGFTWTPEGLMLYARNGAGAGGNQPLDAESVVDTGNAKESHAIIGFGTGPAERFCILCLSGGTGTGVNGAYSFHRRDAIWLGQNNIPADAPTTWTDAGDINSAFSPDAIEFVLDLDDPDRTTAAWMFAIAIGPPIIEFRQRLVKYQHNTYQSRAAGRTLVHDVLGRTVPNHDVKPDNFIFAGGPSFPTPTKYSSLIVNPATFYIESVQATEERLRIETNRESLFTSLVRKMAG